MKNTEYNTYKNRSSSPNKIYCYQCNQEKHKDRSTNRELSRRRSYSSSAVRTRDEKGKASCCCYVRQEKPVLTTNPRDAPTTYVKSPRVCFSETDDNKSPERIKRAKSPIYYPCKIAS